MNDTFNIEKHREYLRLLAVQQLAPQLRGKLDASDVVQEALLLAEARRDQFRGTTQAEWFSWLRVILKNQLAAAFRRYTQKCRDVELEAAVAASLSQSSMRIEDWLEGDESLPGIKAARNEQILLLADALATLPDDQREAIELFHLQGLALADVGKVMDRSKPSVAGLMYRGVSALRQKLAALDSRSEHE